MQAPYETAIEARTARNTFPSTLNPEEKEKGVIFLRETVILLHLS